MSSMTAKRNKPEKAAKAPRSGRNINVWVDGSIGDDIDKYLEDTRPTPTLVSLIETALEDFFIAKGIRQPRGKQGAS